MVNYFLVDRLVKQLKFGIANRGGRNFLGRICVNGRGGGSKRVYRIVDYYRRVCAYGVISRIIFDNNRFIYLGLIIYQNGLVSFICLQSGLKLGDELYSGIFLNSLMVKNLGWAVPLANINLFSTLNNLELTPFSGAKIARSAGTSCILIGRFLGKVLIKLNSGWQIKISDQCIASVGIVSNPEKKFLSKAKAGKNRALGFKPKVRGVAKNPCDHPHGGGNGKKSALVAPVSAWGRLCKGTPTKQKKLDKKKRRLFKIIK